MDTEKRVLMVRFLSILGGIGATCLLPAFLFPNHECELNKYQGNNIPTLLNDLCSFEDGLGQPRGHLSIITVVTEFE